MMKEEELLQYVHKTADMGYDGLLSVMSYVKEDKLRSVLQDQIHTYDELRTEAKGLLKQRGVEPKGPGAVAKTSAEVMSMGKLMMDSSSSKIAEMAIQGNSMGITKTIQHLHDYTGEGVAKSLAQRLLAAEEAGAEELKAFL